ncbi:hypothetical protein LCGC14_2590710 [marine sediment metagenome]|uniref:Uncharacterized protein n=1 Tax=marine sediment metagenome TaxID=412755 RepID=A0A0F9AC27_9ZZZZ
MEKVTFLEETPGGSLQKAMDSILKDFRDQKIESIAVVWRRQSRPDESFDYKYVKEHFIWSRNSIFELQGLLQDLNFEISANQRVQHLIKRK